MRTSRIIGLIAVGAISLPLLASCSTKPTVTGPKTKAPIGKQLAELVGSDTAASDLFGFSVATSGTTTVVGAIGHAKYAGRAYVFDKTASGWKQVAELKGSDTAASDEFGSSVAISGTTVVVGAGNHANYAGEAYVFDKTASGWKQVAELKGSDTAAADYFGWSVAVSGTTAVVGAYGHSNKAGRAYVFTKTASGWKQAAELDGSDTVAGDQFGSAVSLSGTTAVVAATSAANSAGRVYVFTKTATGWNQTAELKGSDTAAGDHFGWSVAISGATAVVGAFHHANIAGRVYVFTKTATGWNQTAELKGSDTVAGAGFGISAAFSGATTVVGATGEQGTGRAYIFTKTATSWKQAAELKGSDSIAGNEFGFSMDVSGTTAVVGADNAGRAYVFQA
jgi:hypothetical protein